MKVRIKALPEAKSGLELKLNPALGQNHKAMPWPGGPSNYADDDTEVRKSLKPVPREEANLEAEKGEVAVTPGDGGIPMSFTIAGKRHSQGGTPLRLPAESFIYSDTKDMKIKDPAIIEQFGMPAIKGGYTPADIAKKYNINNFLKILKDPDTDDLQKKTAEGMIASYNLKLAKLALIQESIKGFPTGIPKVAMPYIEQMEINPEQFFAQGQQDTEEPGQQMPMNPDMGTARYGANVINSLIMRQNGGFGGNDPQTGMFSTQSLFGNNQGYLQNQNQNQNPGAGQFNYDITQTNKRKYDGESMANWGIAGMDMLTNIFNWDEKAAAKKAQESLYGADNNFLAEQGNRGMWDQFGNARPDQHVPVQFSGNAEQPYLTQYGGAIKVRIKGLPTAQRGGSGYQWSNPGNTPTKLQTPKGYTYTDFRNSIPASVFDLSANYGSSSERFRDPKTGIEYGRNIPLGIPEIDPIDIFAGVLGAARTIGKPVVKKIGQTIAAGFEEHPGVVSNSFSPGYRNLGNVLSKDKPDVFPKLRAYANTLPEEGVLPNVSNDVFANKLLNKGINYTNKRIDKYTGKGLNLKDPKDLLKLMLRYSVPVGMATAYPVYEEYAKSLGNQPNRPVVIPPVQKSIPVVTKDTTNWDFKEGGQLVELQGGGIQEGTLADGTKYRIEGDIIKYIKGDRKWKIDRKTHKIISDTHASPTNSAVTTPPVKTQGTAKTSGQQQTQHGPIIPAYGDKEDWVKQNTIEGSSPLTVGQMIDFQHSSGKGYGEQGTYEDWIKSNPRFFANWKNSHGDESFDINNKAHLQEYDEFYNEDTWNGVWAQAKQDFRNKGLSEDEADKKARVIADNVVENIGFKGKENTLNAADRKYGDYYRSRKELQFKSLTPPEKKAAEEAKKDAAVQNNQMPIPQQQNTPWWLQDIIKTAGAAGDFFRVKKYNPWQQDPNVHLPEVNMYDPTRELAASSETTQQGVEGLKNFVGPQSFNANFNEMQGQGFKNAADIMSRYNNMNVGVANAHESEVVGILNNAEVARAAGHTQLYDKYNIANQQFDNAKNQARQNLRQSYIDAITNRSKAQALNSVYENYQVDPSTGGMVWMPHGRPVVPSPYDDGMKKAEYASKFYEQYPHLKGNKAAEEYVFGTSFNANQNAQNPFDENQQMLQNMIYQRYEGKS
jgi:hypothetical protein